MLDELVLRFRDPRPLSRPVAFWFLDGVVRPEECEWQIAQMKDQGVHAVIPQKGSGNLQPPYLSESWFRMLGAIYQAAERHGVQVWIYDEGCCPSGSVEKSLAAPDRFPAKAIICELRPVPADGLVEVPQGELLGVFVRGEGAWRQVDDWVQPGGVVRVPRGMSPGEIHFFVARPHVLRPGNFTWGDVDRTNPAATQAFMDRVHREYRWRFGDKFGEVITGVFTDEPAMFEQPVYAANFFEEFRRRRGYDFHPYLPALFFDAGPETARARCDFYDTVASLYAEAFFQPVADWCEENGLVYTGHLWPEEELDAMQSHQGDPFRIYGRMAWPGLDDIVGMKKLNPAVIRLVASASHLFGKERTSCEAFACTGPGFRFQDLKWKTDWLTVCGVDLLIPHLFYYTYEGDARLWSHASFFFQHPGWTHFHHYSNYVGRVCEMLQAGRHVAEVAVLYPGASVWARMTWPSEGHVENFSREDAYGFRDGVPACPADLKQLVGDFQTVADLLINHQHDFDYVDEAALAEALVDAGRLHVGAEDFGVLLLPHVTTLSLPAMRKIAEFARAGGQVIAYGALPDTAREGPQAEAELSNLVEAVFGVGAPGITVRGDPEELLEALPPAAVEVRTDFRPTRDKAIHCQHRRLEDLDIHYLVNHSTEQVRAEISLRGVGEPELWDPDTGNRYRPPLWTTAAGCTVLDLAFEPYQTCFVVLRPQADPALPLWVDGLETVARLDGEWEIEFLRNRGHRYLEQYDRLFEFGKRRAPLAPWAKLGMAHFSGRARYTRRFLWTKPPRDEDVYLDLGRVEQIAEVRLNGQEIGTRLWQPYRVEVTAALHSDENWLEVVVTNGLANIFLHPEVEKPVDYGPATAGLVRPDQLVAGLLGPVTLAHRSTSRA